MATTAKMPKPTASQNRSARPWLPSQYAKPMAAASVTTDRIAFTSLGIAAFRSWDQILRLSPSVVAEWHGRGLVGPLGLAAQALLEEPGVVPVEKMAEQPAVE